MPDAVLWSLAKKKPEPQLYESIQSQTFFDINEKNKIKTTKNTAFLLKEKEKKKSQVSSIPNQFTRDFSLTITNLLTI
ncbi:hypothetical protein CMU59_15490 [Elizabethkingia anophelis]|nr:hypothetical protein [Elizabethkingia anophelis]MDV3600984.1 hypothetical protein [Elizabethkingia anophelis]MDV3606949.1 hypothetical protein [Elizabethkingia anophelis]MDV3640047.1 hypothetical protein [Elizabethkingia anophelis]MDV3649501.1 hypothetical protein [Elizabethkingia anophelis]